MKKALSILSISLLIATSFSSPSYAGNKKLKRAIAIGAAIGAGAVILKKIKDKNKKKKNKSTSSNSNGSSNRSTNKAIQSALNAKGFNAGTPDGVLGKGSRAAISSYQQSIGAEPTGKLTKAQQASLLGAATLATTAAGAANISSQSDIKLAQSYLNWLGYHGDSYDGVMGKKSREKLRQFQVDYGLPPTRKLSPEVIQLLESEANAIDLAERIRNLPDTEVTVNPADAKALYPVCRLSRKFGDINKPPTKECGYVDENGNWAIYPKYTEAYEFMNGFAVVKMKEDEVETYILISNGGQEIKRQPNYISRKKGSPYHIVCDKLCTVIRTDTLDILFQTEGYLSFISQEMFIERKKHQDGKKSTHIYSAEAKKHKVISLDGEIYDHGIYNTNDIMLSSYETKKIWIQNLKTGKIKWEGQFEKSPEDICDGLIGITPPSGDSYLVNSNTYENIPLNKGNVEFKSLYTGSSSEKHCDGNVVLKYSDANVLMNISTGNEITRGYHISPQLLNGENVYIVQNINDGPINIISSNGHEIFSSHDHYLEIFYDKYIVSQEPSNKHSIHKIINGKTETILKNIFSDRIDSVSAGESAEPKFKILIGNISNGISAGEYLINPDGSPASQGGLLEASIYQQACNRAMGKASKNIIPLLQTCARVMYSKLDVSTKTPDPEAHYSNFHVSRYSGLFSGPEEYLEELTKVAEIGSPFAQADLSLLYFQGSKDLELKRDDKLGLYWAYRAAELGHGNSHNNLGIAYMEGLGVEKDLNQALYWFKHAAEQGVEDAIYNIPILEQHLRAQNQPRQSRSFTLGDFIRTVGKNAPSEAELQNQRAHSQCKKSVRSCLASCANIPPPTNMQVFGKSPRQKCEASCGRGSC